jgi:hypothetical protein
MFLKTIASNKIFKREQEKEKAVMHYKYTTAFKSA